MASSPRPMDAWRHWTWINTGSNHSTRRIPSNQRVERSSSPTWSIRLRGSSVMDVGPQRREWVREIMYGASPKSVFGKHPGGGWNDDLFESRKTQGGTNDLKSCIRGGEWRGLRLLWPPSIVMPSARRPYLPWWSDLPTHSHARGPQRLNVM